MSFTVDRIDHVVLSYRDPDGNLVETSSFTGPVVPGEAVTDVLSGAELPQFHGVMPSGIGWKP